MLKILWRSLLELLRVQTAYNTLLADQKPFDIVDLFERSKIKLSLDVLVNLDKRIDVGSS